MKTGSVLYTINGYIAKVTKIENEKLYVEEEYPVTITSNAGSKLEHLIRKQINVYQLSDIGILLFYEKSDETTLNKNAILQLLGLFVLHCGALKNADQMIFIDEGQDYSNFEYFLLRRALGEKATFNIYGDVKQCVNTVNGTLDWENISIESEYKKFEINENYRNSIEITNFVKEELGIKMSPIGISGENPQFIAMEDIELYVKKSVEKNSNVRIAIISNNKKIFNQTFTSETNSIFIGDVIESKGLEFDVVFVNDENMNKNEKYISYTRALSELYIVR